MKKLWLGILATLLVVVFVAPSFAWEFTMTGDFETRFRYFGRADGSKDLFGDMNIQNSPLNALGAVNPEEAMVGFAGPNFYRGFNGGVAEMQSASTATQVAIVRSGFSLAESDAFANDMRMNIIPTIRVNNAVRLSMNVDFAGIVQKYNHRDNVTNGPLNRWYQDRVSENGFDTALLPSINQLKLTVQLPWGVLSYGLAKDFPFGTGALLGHNTRASAFVLVLPYGPFRLIPSLWFARNFDGYANQTANWVDVPNDVPASVNYDSGPKFSAFWAPALTYNNGPMEFYAMALYRLGHLDNAYTVRNVAAARTRVIAPNGPGAPLRTVYAYGGSDVGLYGLIFAAKYNNGRFFLNAEYGFGQSDSRYLPTSPAEFALLGAAFNGAPELHGEFSYGFAEGGALCGPAKLGLMFAWSPGTDRANPNSTKLYTGGLINNQATDAYNYLLFHTYGGGNDAPWSLANCPGGLTFTRDENGQIYDAYALAARFDYAAAANLNLWGSYMWAHRAEQNGFWAGGKGTGGAIGAASNSVATAQAWRAASMNGGANQNPYVDDGYLGWEANLGVDWKLLENFSSKFRYAYWQPGPWFDQAYRVIGQLQGAGAVNANAQMTGRSAIQAFEASVVVDF